MNKFKLKSKYKPDGDQPSAIKKLVEGLALGERFQTLLGVTGSGKTFTMANVIEKINKPTLVIAHNKTLAAQLAQEYKDFFPNNAVHYFVSYYDYYQPEAYIPTSDTYIEKEAQINEEIERLRHASTQALLSRKDVIIVASVSCIYGLGSPEEYEKVNLHISKKDKKDRATLIRELIDIFYERTDADLSPGTLRALGNVVEVMPANEKMIFRIEIEREKIVSIIKIDAITREIVGGVEDVFIFPAKHFITNKEQQQMALQTIKTELGSRLQYFEERGMLLEKDRIKRRTSYDLAMIREVGYVNGIENYSRYFDGRKSGEPPYTLLSYLGDDFLTIV
ncbi:MAG: DEAD/DEAH box helicase family protein, partial [Patescibacteria group bacterium]